MKSLFQVLLISVMVTIAYSCKKDALNPETSNPQPIDTTKDFLKEANSDRSPEYFIRGDFDGRTLYFASISDAYSTDDSSWNGYFVNNSNGFDQINLIRQNIGNSVEIDIYFSQAYIFRRKLPYTIPDRNPQENVTAEIALIDLKNLWRAPEGTPENDFSFYGETYQSIKIVVTSVANHIMEGTFEGTLTSKSGSVITVKNGGFRIQIKVVNK